MTRSALNAQKGTQEGGTMNWSKWVRQLHRWLSIAFTLVVIFDGVAVFERRYTNWMGLLAVGALASMFFTGVYLFVLPYITSWRVRRSD
jgi:hypothetical protein